MLRLKGKMKKIRIEFLLFDSNYFFYSCLHFSGAWRLPREMGNNRL